MIDVLNGRAAQSSCGNSACLSFTSGDPAVDVFIDDMSGGDSVQRSHGPEPETALFRMPSLGVVGFVALKRRRH